jgi:hypothetical protein
MLAREFFNLYSYFRSRHPSLQRHGCSMDKAWIVYEEGMKYLIKFKV